jgi:hypothetical protein
LDLEVPPGLGRLARLAGQPARRDPGSRLLPVAPVGLLLPEALEGRPRLWGLLDLVRLQAPVGLQRLADPPVLRDLPVRVV